MEKTNLMEQSTGKILYEHNSHEQLRTASVTKVMRLLLIMEEFINAPKTACKKLSFSPKVLYI